MLFILFLKSKCYLFFGDIIRDMLKILMLMYMYIWGCKVIFCFLIISKYIVIVEFIGIVN